MGKNYDSNPFLFPSNFPSSPSESITPPSSPSLQPFCSSRTTSTPSSPRKSSSSISRPPLSQSSSCHFSPSSAFGPCAACKFHNRLCSERCYLASFFPPEEVHKFAVVDSVFGTANFADFLQQNSNSSYIPLLILLRDTSQEDEEVHSQPNNYTLSETNIHKQPGADIRELIQGKEPREQSKDHLIPHHSLNLAGIDHSNGAKEITFGTSTDRVRVSLGGELPRYPDDGFSWIEYEQRDVLGAKYPRSYYICTYEYCGATKQVKRCDGDPAIFEVEYQGFHTCPPPVYPEERQEQNNTSSKNQQQHEAQLVEPEFSFPFPNQWRCQDVRVGRTSGSGSRMTDWVWNWRLGRVK